jgi:DNA-binding protein HU-beta
VCTGPTQPHTVHQRDRHNNCGRDKFDAKDRFKLSAVRSSGGEISRPISLRGRSPSVQIALRLIMIRRISMAKKTVAAAKSSQKRPAAKATTTAPVVTLKHIAAQIAEAHEMPTNRAVAMLNDTVDLLSKHLVKGDKVRIVGLGIFQVKRREARMGRNPQTGEAVKIKASKKVTFRASKELKEAV